MERHRKVPLIVSGCLCSDCHGHRSLSVAFLIDMTDPRFFIAANHDVMEFVRRTSPSCHTDVGTPLIEFVKEIPAAHHYSPSYRQLAYVVLHTDANHIFAIGY